MNGRTEVQIKRESATLDKIQSMPIYIQEFYYSISNSKQSTTNYLYVSYVNKFILYLRNKYNKEDINIKEVSINDIDNYMSFVRYKEVKGNKIPTKESYRATVWSALNKFFNFLSTHGYMEKNIMKGSERPKIPTDIHQVAMDENEINKVIHNVGSGVGTSHAVGRQKKWKSRDTLIILLLLYTGMRISALDEINLSDFNDDFTKVTIITKGNKTFDYPISEDMHPYLHKWLDDRKKLLGDIECDALFISNERKRISTNAIRVIVNKYTSGIDKHITPHKFRSTYGTNVYKQTKDIYFVKECMGHSNIATTQRYIVNDGNQRTEASKIMGGMINLNNLTS